MKLLAPIKVFTFKDIYNKSLKEGSIIMHRGKLYKFDGYEYGKTPTLTNIDTNEQIQLRDV
jgi:hypothetical protein